MTRWRIRGGNRLVGIFGQLGMLNVVAQYQLGRGVSFNVPLFRADTCWDKRDIEGYERPLIHSFCHLLEPLFDVVLFDCGADIGTFSALVCSKTSRITQVIAFEPNPDVAGFLKRNLSQLLIPSKAIIKAVSFSKARAGWRLQLMTTQITLVFSFLAMARWKLSPSIVLVREGAT